MYTSTLENQVFFHFGWLTETASAGKGLTGIFPPRGIVKYAKKRHLQNIALGYAINLQRSNADRFPSDWDNGYLVEFANSIHDGISP